MPVCHTRISPKLSEIYIWLLGNSNRKPGFSIQSLPSDRFAIGSTVPPFWVFQGWHFAHSNRNGPVGLVIVVNGSVGTITSRHHTGHRGRPTIPITDDIFYVLSKLSHQNPLLRLIKRHTVFLSSYFLKNFGQTINDKSDGVVLKLCRPTKQGP